MATSEKKKRRKPQGGARAFADTIEQNLDRANVMFLLPQDSRLYLTETTRSAVNRKAEWLWQNFGIVKEIVAGIARHAVGKGIAPQFKTSNRDWNKKAAAAVDKYFLSPSLCDLGGRRNGYEAQTWAVEQYILRGEVAGAFAQNPRLKSPTKDTGVPSFWLWDSNDITTPREQQADNVIIHDGVELGEFAEPVAYHVRTFEDEIKRYPAADCFHWFKAHSANQSRGVSHLAQAANSLVDIHELKRLTTRTAKAQQLLALVIKGLVKKKSRGALGALSRAADGNGDSGSTAQDTAQLEKLYGTAGAGIAYVDADGDAKLLSSNSPSPLIEPFITDLLMRDASLAPGVPVEFFWNPSKLSSANIRFILARADLLFQHLADALIYRFIDPLVVRFILWMVEAGLLEAPADDSWKDTITYRLPRRVTVDNGRDGRIRIEELHNGLANLRGLFDELGADWMPETAEWIDEFIEFKAMCKDRGLDDKETEALLARWRPLPPGSITGQPAQKAEPTDKPTEEDAAAA